MIPPTTSEDRKLANSLEKELEEQADQIDLWPYGILDRLPLESKEEFKKGLEEVLEKEDMLTAHAVISTAIAVSGEGGICANALYDHLIERWEEEHGQMHQSKKSKAKKSTATQKTTNKKSVGKRTTGQRRKRTTKNE